MMDDDIDSAPPPPLPPPPCYQIHLQVVLPRRHGVPGVDQATEIRSDGGRILELDVGKATKGI